MPSLDSLAKEINKYQSFLLSGHVNPEGDCGGSLIAVERLLKKLGKKTQIYCEYPSPNILDTIDPGSWKQVKDFEKPPHAEAAITVDTPSWERLGTAAPSLQKIPTINIDHHISNHNFGTFNYIDEKASACGEIIFDLFKKFKVEVDEEDAKVLYISISTDTGSFRYSNTTPKTHNIISELLKTGMNVEKINQAIFGNYEDRKLKLIELLLSQRKYEAQGKIAYAALCQKDLVETGGNSEDLEGAIDLIRGVKGVEVCFLMTEWDKDTQRISFRSTGEVNVNNIAKELGGGGHAKAAGACIQGKQSEVILKVLKIIENHIT